MLFIVETLKEFRNILLGQKITVYTDHMNLVNPTTNQASVQTTHWHWLIEEYGPTFEYTKGPKNVVADALSCLDADFIKTINDGNEALVSEEFDIVTNDKMPYHAYPLSSKLLAEYQQKDVTLMWHLQHHAEYFSKAIEGEELVLFHQCIYIPKPLQLQVLEWYHGMLCHPWNRPSVNTSFGQVCWMT